MKKLIPLVVLLFALPASAASNQVPKNLPSKSKTPGYYNPAVKQSNIKTTICVKGWTSTVRPPWAYTDYLKGAQIKEWGLPGGKADYEEDHFVPLELGGSAYDTRNIWPESHPQSFVADNVEFALRQQVCAGTLTLSAARKQMKAYKYANG